MKPVLGTFESEDSVPLFYSHYEDPDAVVDILLVHGLLEHGGRYDCFQSRLREAGIHASVYISDYRGHGRSQGPRGWVPSFRSYILDQREFYLKVVSERSHAGRPLILLGHSAGGLIVYLMQARAYPGLEPLKVDGLAFSSPAFRVSMEIPLWKKGISKLISKTPLSKFLIPTGFIQEHISHDELEVAKLKRDNLTLDRITPKLWESYMDAMGLARSTRLSSEVPLLFQVAGSDQIADFEVSEIIFEKIECPKKKWHLYPEDYHEIFNEMDREKVFSDLAEWIKNEIL